MLWLVSAIFLLLKEISSEQTGRCSIIIVHTRMLTQILRKFLSFSSVVFIQRLVNTPLSNMPPKTVWIYLIFEFSPLLLCQFRIEISDSPRRPQNIQLPRITWFKYPALSWWPIGLKCSSCPQGAHLNKQNKYTWRRIQNKMVCSSDQRVVQ